MIDLLFWTAVVLGCIFGLLVLYFAWWSNTPEGKQYQSELEARQLASQNDFESIFLEHGFDKALLFVGRHGGIAINPKMKLLALQSVDWSSTPIIVQCNDKKVKTHHGKWALHPFSDIVGAELYLDEEKVMHTSGGKSLAGATMGFAVAGPLGAVVGARGGSRKTKEVSKTKSVKLRIYLKNFDTPVQDIEFFDPNFFMAPDAGADKEVVELAKTWVKRVELCILDRAQFDCMQRNDQPHTISHDCA